MGKQTGPPIQESDREWMKKQHVFFVATAPLSPTHHVNVSPKSGKEFRVVDESTVAYLDYSGSGSETAAHLMENGRMTILFVAFEGPPKIIRLYGFGRFVRRQEILSSEHSKLASLFDGELPGQSNCDAGFRCIVVLKVSRISQSCGYSIPEMDYKGERDVLKTFASNKGDDGMHVYRGYKNSFSIDGLRSIGQLEMNGTPSSVVYQDGYYFSKYNSSDILGQFKVLCKMNYINGKLFSWCIDASLVVFGAALGWFCASRSKKNP